VPSALSSSVQWLITFGSPGFWFTLAASSASLACQMPSVSQYQISPMGLSMN